MNSTLPFSEPINATTSGSTCRIDEVKNTPSKDSWLWYRIHHFSPAWFAGVMGCGITSTILYNFPFEAGWLRILGLIFYGFTMILFSVFTTMLLSRFIFWPSQWRAVLRHPAQAAFLGCYPMGMATLINTTTLVFKDSAKYPHAWIACYVLWWINVGLSVASCWGVLFIMFKYQRRSNVNTLNAVILLCVVPLLVCASTGSLVLPMLPQHLHMIQLVVSFLMWANGEILAFMLITIYVYRLLRSNLPVTPMLISSLLVVGPLGQGAFGILHIGVSASLVLPNLIGVPAQHVLVSENASQFLVYTTCFIALSLLSFAFFWMAITLFSCITACRPGYTELNDNEKSSLASLPGPFAKFTPAWWAMTFPVGTVSTACTQLYKELNLLTFGVLGAIFGVFVVFTVLLCLSGWIRFGLLSDDLFKIAETETSPKSETLP
ncbi:hypothetical protein NADFUDRAFT_84344 [Nadsonia fulvescens var. elongata DSM 6958]|uniref:C4-dicarboxylate transporter/malic acid transport protein n=1 Tax=Nadsonia fulvescens var. elongata DSM 6958 TaxID=857566 RepID=A0A1E3PFL3_9ASCO|nr:hypothetical protein NADFUDRAFT_84344 [Nadsonia fulvescens var. elongata DSM 6958]